MKSSSPRTRPAGRALIIPIFQMEKLRPSVTCPMPQEAGAAVQMARGGGASGEGHPQHATCGSCAEGGRPAVLPQPRHEEEPHAEKT